jgi:putative peptide zinc metalloprotease protein
VEQRLSGDEPLVAAFEAGTPLPTEEEPAIAVVLVPTDDPSSGGPGNAPAPGTEPSDGAWVFPFDQPLPPEEGDNQALAVNTTDDSVTYDVAFALVWADGDEALNVNEAHAYASCSNCVAVAVAFQVVLVMDDAQVIVPQNLAVAANYDCYQCITAAIASQLVLSVQDAPGEEDLRALGAVWNELLQFADTITSHSLTEITAQLETIQGEIIAILMDAPPVESTPAPQTASPTSPDADPSGSASAPAPTPAEPTTTEPTPTAPPEETPSESPPSEATTTAPAPTEEPAPTMSPSPSEPDSPSSPADPSP